MAACASTKYKSFDTVSNFKTAGKLIEGKTPKEAAAIIGKPMSAYFKDGDKSVYYMVYPMADKDISMTDLMFNDRLECLAFNFEQEKGYKFADWSSNTGFTCGAIKGQKLDMSLID
jgi:hypothetical protein